MKKHYEKPVFFAESYHLTVSVSSCDFFSPSPVYEERSVQIETGEYLSPTQNSAPGYGGAGSDGGNLQKAGIDSVILFNDGPAGKSCEFDWNGKNGNVIGPDGHDYGSYEQAFYSSETSPVYAQPPIEFQLRSVIFGNS